MLSTVRTLAAGASLGRIAPVGHVATHCPQEVHTDDAIAPSPKTPTFVA